MGVARSMVSNMTCVRTNFSLAAVAGRRLEEGEEVCVTNYTTVITAYSVTVVVEAEELYVYAGSGEGTVQEVALEFEQKMETVA